MTKPGNWGTWAIIETPRKKRIQKDISCELCTAFHSKEKVCRKNSTCNPLSSWKSCKSFYFKTPYDTARYWNKLVKEGGYL